MKNWLDWLRPRRARRAQVAAAPRRKIRLGFDALEERATPAVTTTLISVALPTTAGNATSITSASPGPTFSADGNLMVFASDATNLVANDTNNAPDIFLANRTTGAITRISVDASGVEADGASYFPSISADGRFVAFQSYADNLVTGPGNGTSNIFVKDLQTGAVSLVSADASGGIGDNFSSLPAISSDGQFVVFASFSANLTPDDTDSFNDIFRKNLQTGAIDLVSVTKDGVKGDQDAVNGAISADGRFIAFATNATTLLPGGGDGNGKIDIYRKDMETGDLVLVTADNNGTIGDGDASLPAISADGNLVAFVSSATNLVSGDTAGFMDVFVKNMTDQTVTRVSVAHDGSELDADANNVTMSDDGSLILFSSAATNAVTGDTNGQTDIFARDLVAGTTTRISTTGANAEINDGGDGGRISPDGSLLAFYSTSNNLDASDNNSLFDVYVKNLNGGGGLTLISHGAPSELGANDNSFAATGAPHIDPDGSVVFISAATNLVAGGDANGSTNFDVYVRFPSQGVTLRASQAADGTQGNGDSSLASITANLSLFNGGFLAFSSSSDNLVAGDTNGFSDIFLESPVTGQIVLINPVSGVTGNGDSSYPVLAGNGQVLVYLTLADNLFDDATPGVADIVAYNLVTGDFTLVSAGADGHQVAGDIAGVSVSDDGRYVAFATNANLLPGDANGNFDVYVKDLQSGALTLISKNSNGVVGDQNSFRPVISGDGRFIAFTSQSTNLIEGDTNGTDDIYLSDWQSGGNGVLVRASILPDGTQTNGLSDDAAISRDGRYVAFDSDATNLVANDNNSSSDVFVKDMQTGTVYLVSQNIAGQIGNDQSLVPSISADGRLVAYTSKATNLATLDTNTFFDVFLATIDQAPTVNVTGNDTIAEGDPLALDASGTTDPENDSLTFTWDLNGDGVFGDATGAVISLTPAELATLGLDDGPSTRIATLRVDDGFGPVDFAFTLTITNTPPTPTITPGVFVANEGQAASFSASATDPSSSDQTAGFTFAWSVTLGGTPFTTGSGSSFSFTLTNSGNYVVTLNATDQDGGVGTTTYSFTAANLAPTIQSLNATDTGLEGSAISFTPTVTDPGADDVTAGFTFSWTVLKNGAAFTEGSGDVVTFTPDDDGSYLVSVVAHDQDGGNSEAMSATIAVANVAPTIFLPTTAGIDEGSTFTLPLVASDPGNDTITQWQVSWGDGSPTEIFGTGGGPATHVYADGPKTWTLSVSATDEDGTVTATQQLTINDVAPTVALTGSNFADVNNTYTIQLGPLVDPGTDTVTNVQLKWGDGTTDFLANDGFNLSYTHTYTTAAATATIQLTIVNEDGTFVAGTKTVEIVHTPPTIAVSGAATSVEGSSYTLTLGAISNPANQTITGYRIAWGDGATDTGNGTPPSTANHTYADGPASRTITVSLLNGSDAYTNPTTKSVSISDVAPTVSLSGAGAIGADVTYSLTLGALVDPGADTVTAVSILWGDGGVDTIPANGFNQTYTHVYTTSATSATIHVSVTNEDGAFDAGSKTITIDHTPATIAISGASSTLEGSTYSLQLGAITNPASRPITGYTIDWGDGQTDPFSGTPSGTKTHTYLDGPASRTITVTLLNGANAYPSPATQSVSVANVEPTSNLSAPSSVVEGTSFTLTISTIADPGIDTVSAYSVNWGDGASTQGSGLPPATLTHAYADNSVARVITLTVTDEDGDHVAGTTSLVVTNAAPVVNAGNNATINEGDTFTRAGSYSDLGANDTATATVNFGDGQGPVSLTLNADKTFNLSHVYAQNGTYTVNVAVTDNANDTGTASFTVTVNNVAPTFDAGDNASANEGATFARTSSFTDPGADTWTITVNYGDNTGNQSVTPSGKNYTLSHVYAQDGTYTVTVTIADADGGSNSDTFTITIANVAPTVNTGSDASIILSQTLTRAGSFTDPGADTWTATVNYGDGSGANPLTLNADKTFTLSHVYTQAGIFPVTVSVNDGTTSTPAIFNVTVTAVTLSLSANTVVERSANGTVVGAVTASDSTFNTAATFTLTNDAGGIFALNGHNLVVANGNALNAATNPTLTVHVRATNNGATVDQDFTIQVLVGDKGDDFVGRDASTGELFVAKSTGSRFNTTNYQGVFDPTQTWVDFGAGDFDGDGNDDVVARNLVTAQWFLARNTGNGAFTVAAWEQWNNKVNFVDVKFADFNNDGKCDIIAREPSVGDWWISFSKGTTGQAEMVGNWDKTVTWVDVAIGDVNRDGRADIVGRKANTGQIFASYNTASTQILGGSKLTNQLDAWATLSDGNKPENTTWVDVQLADMDGDGKLDVIGRVQKTGFWFIDYGTAGRPGPSMFWTAWNPKAQWAPVTTADVNDDGKADLVGHTLDAGEWWVGLSTSRTTAVNNQRFGGTTGFFYTSVFVGDFNNDGKMDVAGLRQSDQAWQVGLSSGADYSFSIWDAWPNNPARINVLRGKIAF